MAEENNPPLAVIGWTDPRDGQAHRTTAHLPVPIAQIVCGVLNSEFPNIRYKILDAITAEQIWSE